MVLARRLFDLVQREHTGLLLLHTEERSSEPTVALLRGWVHAIYLGSWTKATRATEAKKQVILGEAQLRHLLALADSRPTLFFREEEEDPRLRRGACSPFHPGACLRAHFDSTAVSVAILEAKLHAKTLRLSRRPPAQCLYADEGPAVALLGRPIVLETLLKEAPGPASRTLRLLAFVDAMGILEATTRVVDLALLGVGLSASAEEIRSAYRRRAREQHPDLHPGASVNERRELEHRFAELTAAYRRLV